MGWFNYVKAKKDSVKDKKPEPKADPPLCINCTHCVVDTYDTSCMRPQYNLVNGLGSLMERCSGERARTWGDDPCGKDGKFFQEKQADAPPKLSKYCSDCLYEDRGMCVREEVTPQRGLSPTNLTCEFTRSVMGLKSGNHCGPDAQYYTNKNTSWYTDLLPKEQ